MQTDGILLAATPRTVDFHLRVKYGKQECRACFPPLHTAARNCARSFETAINRTYRFVVRVCLFLFDFSYFHSQFFLFRDPLPLSRSFGTKLDILHVVSADKYDRLRKHVARTILVVSVIHKH